MVDMTETTGDAGRDDIVARDDIGADDGNDDADDEAEFVKDVAPALINAIV